VRVDRVECDDIEDIIRIEDEVEKLARMFGGTFVGT
jgi:hypothetical protein